jgi:Dolichyl-phosphate-mannose-protein mannosyltransferase
VNPCRHPLLPALLAAALVLMSAAWMRGAEYDEQYTLFLTAGVARPDWPADAFPAGEVRRLEAGHASFAAIAHDLRTTDVHPPLYFWTVAAWRALVGDSLFAARLASVLFSLAALGMVAAIARLVGIPPATAVLLTVGCYGFVYTATIARGFALAQLLTLAGVTALLCAERRASGWIALAGGALLGAATFSNYLAAFAGCAALLWSSRSGVCAINNALPLPLGEGAGGGVRRFSDAGHPSPYPFPQGEGEDYAAPPLPLMPAGRHRRLPLAAGLGFAVWLPADLWFFLAQRQSRLDQFAPFHAGSAAVQLARYFAANLLGGLPLYLGGLASHALAAALALLLLALTGLTIWHWRGIAVPGPRHLLAMAAAAPPIGLLLLGLAFNNAPIELRYLAFAMPFVGLLLAGAFATLPRCAGHTLCGLVLSIQTLSLVGLMTRQETMQPARATAGAAAALVGDGVVLLPHGNDGVGIVGAFAIEAPPTLRLLVVGKDVSAAQMRARVGRYPRVVLALLSQDADSRATVPVMREAFTDPCWRGVGEGFNVLAFVRICSDE